MLKQKDRKKISYENCLYVTIIIINIFDIWINMSDRKLSEMNLPPATFLGLCCESFLIEITGGYRWGNPDIISFVCSEIIFN